MHGHHEPRREFVEGLERQIASEIRRQRRFTRETASMWTFGLRPTLVVLALMLVSMGLGAGVMAAAMQAQDGARRARLVLEFEGQAELARQRLATVTTQLQATEGRIAIGTATQEERLQRRVDVAEAQAQLTASDLQLQEVRVTGQAPLDDLSAPAVAGRDFVSERLRAGSGVPEAALELERLRLRELERRQALGASDALEVEAARTRAFEVQVAIEAVRRKIEIRQRFLEGGAGAAETELRALEATAQSRLKTLAPQIALAQKQLDRTTAKVALGATDRIELAEATLRMQRLETERAKAELDVEVVRGQIQQLHQPTR
jgi:hypothetical protein